jgi:RNA 2',3'-cyclic 3'-phosphodiesterase
MARAFVALLLTDEARRAVVEVLDGLRPLSRAVAWVPPANLHLTLRFLGEQSEARLGEALEALGEAAEACPPFEVALHGLGAFPGLERPRIVWLGLAEGALTARGLQARVMAVLAARGFPPEARPWHPHLTLGRVPDERRWRREGGASLRQAVTRAGSLAVARLPVTALSLMTSELLPSGARYTERARRPLGGRAG